MNKDDKNTLRRIRDRIDMLLTRKEQLGTSNLPMEFNGLTAEMLFNESPANKSLVLFIDVFIQEGNGKSDSEILERFTIVNEAITKIFDNLKKIPEANEAG